MLFIHPSEDIQWEMRFYCEDEARKAFPTEQRISIEKRKDAAPISAKRSKEWLYIGEVLNDTNQSIGVVFCDWYDPKLNKWGVPDDHPPKVKVKKYSAQP